jgi:hypothetical protein
VSARGALVKNFLLHKRKARAFAAKSLGRIARRIAPRGPAFFIMIYHSVLTSKTKSQQAHHRDSSLHTKPAGVLIQNLMHLGEKILIEGLLVLIIFFPLFMIVAVVFHINRAESDSDGQWDEAARRRGMGNAPVGVVVLTST